MLDERENNNGKTMEVIDRRLMWHGMFLFLLGLLTGFAEPHFVNIRMGLAAQRVRLRPIRTAAQFAMRCSPRRQMRPACSSDD